MKKSKFINISITVLLSLGLAYFGYKKLTYSPEEDFAKKMKKKYNKEFVINITGHTVINLRHSYGAIIFPKEIEGTPNENDAYYRVIGELESGKLKDDYLNVVLQEQANDFYSLKLKELFGENIFLIFRIEGNCEKDNLQDELLRRKKIFEENPDTKSYPLDANIYIFGKLKNDEEKEIYREKIYKFVEYLKETEAFEDTGISIKLIDENFFTREKFKEIVKKEREKQEEDLKKLQEKLENFSTDWKPILQGNPEIMKEIKKIQEKNEKSGDFLEGEEQNTNKTIELKDMKEAMKYCSISRKDELLNRYGEALISTNIVSPKRAMHYVWGRKYINPYEKKEDIFFEGEEIKYPNGTIKELSEYERYYITEIKNNKRNGISTKYNPKGKVIWVGEFKDNLLEGESKYYDEDEGDMYKKEIYKNGLLKADYYYLEEKLIKETEYREDGIKVVKDYDEINESLKSVSYYRDDELVQEIEYKEDGVQIVKKYNEENGRLISTHYFKNGIEQENL